MFRRGTQLNWGSSCKSGTGVTVWSVLDPLSNHGEPPVNMVYSKTMLGSALFVTVVVRTKALFLNEMAG